MQSRRFVVLSCLALSLAACDDSSGGDSSGTTGGDGSTSAVSGSSGGTTSGASDSATSTSGDGTSSSSTGDPTEGGSSSSTGEAGESSSSGGGESSTGEETGGEALPDLDMNDPNVIADTTSSIYIETQNFDKSSCAFQDGCLAGTGQRRLLRFDTITPNLGNADFYAGNNETSPELFEYSECQGQYVLADYAQYRLLDLDGNVVANGQKAAFALIDLAMWVPGSGPGQYGFNNMGISVGWADIYGAGLSCQWVDITDVPPGDYQLELSINPEHVIEEITFDNNILLLDVTVTEDDTNPGGGKVPDEWTCDNSYYGAGDGCDCGCGVVDPDCADATAASCDYCIGGCSVNGCDDIDPNDNAVCI